MCVRAFDFSRSCTHANDSCSGFCLPAYVLFPIYITRTPALHDWRKGLSCALGSCCAIVVTRPDGFGRASWVQSRILGLAGSSHPVFPYSNNGVHES